MRLLLIIFFVTAFCSAAEKSNDSLPYSFKAGDTIRASSVNATLNFLLTKITKTQTAVDSLGKITVKLSDSLSKISKTQAAVDSLGKLTAILSDSLASAKNSLKLPIGTIIASMLKPDDFKKQFPTDADNWKLADSSTASNEYFKLTGNANIPDLRGRFLRGMNENIDSSKGDPDGNKRTVGSYQSDSLKFHNHKNDTFSLLLTISGYNTAGTFVSKAYPDVIQAKPILPYGGAETRPRNVAVYWYIKVK